jgi:hypothetical protein
MAARFAALLFALVLSSPGATAAQDRSLPADDGGIEVFPAIVFDVGYQKFLPPSSAYSPYYSWDTHLAFDATMTRRGRSAVEFAGMVQTAGTENFGSRIGVGGTGYVLRVTFRRALSPATDVALGVSHLSTHLTRDLDEKTLSERARGAEIPHVADPSEYNAPFVEWRRRFLDRRFEPEMSLGLAPVNIRLTKRARGWNRRPLYAATRWHLWSQGLKTLVVETVHEVGAGPLNAFVGALEFARPQTSSRLQLFVALVPDDRMHVSPRHGGVRGGLAAGLHLTVRSAAE